LAEMRETSETLAAHLSQPVPLTLAQTEEQRIIADFVAQAPKLDKEALCSGFWNAGLEKLRDLITEGRKFTAANEQAHKRFDETAWEKEFSEARSHIATHGKSLLRFLNSKYRAAIAEIRIAMTTDLPKLYSQRLVLIDCAISGQQALRKIREYDSIGLGAFGVIWRKEKTNWNQLEAILNWVARQNEVGLGSSFRQMFAGISDQATIATLAELLGNQITAMQETVQNLFVEISLDCSSAFSVQEIRQISLETLSITCGGGTARTTNRPSLPTPAWKAPE